jgi:hypothetical protein
MLSAALEMESIQHHVSRYRSCGRRLTRSDFGGSDALELGSHTAQDGADVDDSLLVTQFEEGKDGLGYADGTEEISLEVIVDLLDRPVASTL